ncbi:MAG: RluA family pseudouridine synthase [Oscillospiraceae bacterium]|jgi:23S rRNA pseudouridine1911/1915/1917 synthase|nr:RluA family pseudouridine synthase [Oscillospiraceae bacterium]
MSIFEFYVKSSEKERIDIFLSKKIKMFSRSFLSKIIEKNKVSVERNNILRIAKKNHIVELGEKIKIEIDENFCEHHEEYVVPQDISIEIVYEDRDLMVVNKPKGMTVHPAPGNYDGTLVNSLVFHRKNELSNLNGIIRPGIVHRIDKDTSGLLLVAKNNFSHRLLADQIKNHSLKREYEAIVIGNLKSGFGTIDAPIGRHPKDRKKMTVTERNSRCAVTHYEVLRNFKGFSHIKLVLETGRTHQIRVHMAHIGHHVLGDRVYGNGKKFQFLKSQCLHARTIGFVHPFTNKYLEFSSDSPDYFAKTLKKLINNYNCL